MSGRGRTQTLGQALAEVAGRLQLRGSWDDYRPTLAELRAMPPTEVLTNARAELERAIAELEPGSELTAGRYRAELERASRREAWGLERDRLAAGRPAGCWCLGDGGDGQAALQWFGDEPAPEDWFVYRRYCVCPESEVARQHDAERLEEGRRRKQRYLLDLFSRGRVVPLDMADFSLASWAAAVVEREPRAAKRASEILEKIRAWLGTDDWLLLYGVYGTGKSGLAAGIVRELMAELVPVVYVNVVELLFRLRATYHARKKGVDPEELGAESEESICKRLESADVLVLDDLGKEKWSPWVEQVLYYVINQRVNNRKRTIVTTNLRPEELAGQIGAASADRIRGKSKLLEVNTPNLR